jgi:hypothetical protein
VQDAVTVPLQAPPQLVPPPAQAVRSPCGAPVAGEQVPTDPATSHASHCPSQARSQQTPSTQSPVPHSPAAPQTCPGLRLGTHAPEEQKSPSEQSLSWEQVARHAVAPQMYGSQACVCAAGQCPEPSQVAAKVWTSPVQEASRQLEDG